MAVIFRLPCGRPVNARARIAHLILPQTIFSRDTSHVFRVIEIGDEHLETFTGVARAAAECAL